MTDAQVAEVVRERVRRFVEEAPMTAAQAATVILDGVKAERWRILVGEDAKKIDAKVRETLGASLRHRFLPEIRGRSRLEDRALTCPTLSPSNGRRRQPCPRSPRRRGCRLPGDDGPRPRTRTDARQARRGLREAAPHARRDRAGPA